MVFFKQLLNLKIFEDVLSKVFKTERESENITNLLEVSQLAIKSNSKSIAFASAVKSEDPSGIRIVSEKSSVLLRIQLLYRLLNHL